MKRLFFILLSTCMVGISSAQDIIVKNDGSIIKAKVLELTDKQIKYKSHTNPDGPLYTINIDGVLSITYENGEKETFSNITIEDTKTQINNQGISDRTNKEDLKAKKDIAKAIKESRIADLKAKRKTAKIIVGVSTGIIFGGALIGGILTGSTILIIGAPVVAVLGGVINGLLTKNYDTQIEGIGGPIMEY